MYLSVTVFKVEMKTNTQSSVLMEGEHSTEQWCAERLKCMGTGVSQIVRHVPSLNRPDLLHEAIQGEVHAKLFSIFHKPVKVPQQGTMGILHKALVKRLI